MMFIRLNKDNRQFILSDKKLEKDLLNVYDEIEVNASEVLKLIRSSVNWKIASDNCLVANFISDDCGLYKLFTDIKTKHQSDSGDSKLQSKSIPDECVKDLNTRVIYYVEGTSKLIRKNDSKQIFVARRVGRDDVSYIDSVIINNQVRERFFKDAKRSTYYKKHNKYVISNEDRDVYNYWSNFIDNLFKSYKDLSEHSV